MIRLGLCLAFFATLLSACATMPRPYAAACSLDAYPLARAASELPRLRTHGDQVQTLADLLSSQSTRFRPNLQSAPRVLLLSGGSQHGAFGGGFLAGLKESNSFVDYDVVTGISTGAIQSPFAFLANADEPTDRTYPPFMAKSVEFGKVSQSNMTDLTIAYLIERESDLVRVRRPEYLGLAVSGSLATFQPMRKLGLGLISPGTLQLINDHSRGRLLLVGVTNLKDATTYALDLTALAQHFAQDPAHNDADRQCFVDAILASAAVPPGIAPIVLRTHVKYFNGQTGKVEDGDNQDGSFIDGGSRYAVFYDQLQAIHNANSGKPVDIDVIVNGVTHLGDWVDPVTQAAVEKYSVVTVMERAADVLESQARETSIEAAKNATNGGHFRIASLSTKDSDAHIYPSPGHASKLKPMTCNDWARSDKAHFHPMEFYPHYMHCILKYGKERALRGDWSFTK